ncbi:MAG: hypothetical protein J0H76_10385 [Sphingobacteriales bacterium]|nr:hypothetical protein [Sphingobacteriales bacterium]
MNTIKKIFVFLLLLPLAGFAQEKGTLLNISEITVKPGQDAQFIEGVKLWKECYLKHKGTDHWNIWHRVQGVGNVYVLAGPLEKWADMDKKDTSGDACNKTVRDFIMPHIEKIDYNIAQLIPQFSRPAMKDTKLIWVTFFKIKNTPDFMDVVKGVSDALKTTEGNYRGYWYRIMGGAPEAADYFTTEPFKGFADLDNEPMGIWKVYEKVNGTKATEAIRAKLRSALALNWSYLYTLSEDISN